MQRRQHTVPTQKTNQLNEANAKNQHKIVHVGRVREFLNAKAILLCLVYTEPRLPGHSLLAPVEVLEGGYHDEVESLHFGLGPSSVWIP